MSGDHFDIQRILQCTPLGVVMLWAVAGDRRVHWTGPGLVIIRLEKLSTARLHALRSFKYQSSSDILVITM